MNKHIDYFSDRQHLSFPGNRAPYSDRMAYLLAQVSSLAYKPIEVPQLVADSIRAGAEEASVNSLLQLLAKIQACYGAADPAQREALIGELDRGGLYLVDNLKHTGGNYTDTQGLVLTTSRLLIFSQIQTR
ncbi:hypothetical protein [Microbulbifer discodermiae]|uniref:hypothetical protein n=1 Tax=Microbulbifer sp. 2201CG32-9 TaxID=3232309 RepID=UPI00345BE130